MNNDVDNSDIFYSSDSVRSARPLKHVQYAIFDGPVPLESGGRLEQVRVAYETYGELNQARDNVILICHALSGDSHVAAHDSDDDPGWWDIAVGPGKSIDTDKYFVVCPNILGGCRGTTGPNCLNPTTGKPYGPDFPKITIGDMVEVQRLLIDYLGIDRLRSVIGGSMGGMLVLEWAIRYPERVGSSIAIATCPRLTSQGLAFDVIGRNAITSSPDFNGGWYYDQERGPVDGMFLPATPVRGLAIARMIGHITYLSREAMREKFGADRYQPRQVDSEFEKDTSVASYLAHQGDKFVERFDANSYIVITRAMDGFDIGDGEDLVASLAPARCRFLLVSFTSDWLFPADQSRSIVNALLASNKSVSYCNVTSPCGHDAFLLPDQLEIYGGLISGFLSHTDEHGETDLEPESDAQGKLDDPDTSIFHGKRIDYDFLESLIVSQSSGPSASVLDLGCGDGRMLLRLKRRGWRRLLGVEIDQNRVLACVKRGIDCIHADLNEGLHWLGDKQFDFVLLSRTLQAVYDVNRVIGEMLRVGRRCIVSFPNFAYKPLRKILAEQGRAPVSAGLLRYKWYDTPNIRFLSIADFEDYCKDRGAKVHRLIALNTETHSEVKDDPNLNADLAIFVISK